jgi:hypothetical protein
MKVYTVEIYEDNGLGEEVYVEKMIVKARSKPDAERKVAKMIEDDLDRYENCYTKNVEIFK